MKVIKAIYNFIVGDMVILVGVVVTMLILALFNSVPGLTVLKVASGAILVVAVLVILLTTLSRETKGKH
ncbi:MAG TPA: hypothetical protein VH164_05845 [Ktedonobacteraceae bacterium]|jgi:hypothetical protein|nr:hypothetical protein [Ktedonobacteraceae bacterium]